MGVFHKGNRWYAEFRVDGKKKVEVVKVEGKAPELVNKRDALDFLAIKRSQVARGEYMAAKEKAVQFEKLAQAFLEWANENYKRPERDAAAVKQLLSHFEGRNVHSLSLFDVEKYKSARKKEGRKPETINKELGALRRMLNLAASGNLNVKISKNPLAGMKLLRVPERRYRVIKGWEFEKLYAAAPMHFKPILLCAYVTGMRRGELQKLRWSEVDLEKRRIHVIETKNGESRSIPIVGDLYKTLSEMQPLASGEYVFTGPLRHYNEPGKSTQDGEKTPISKPYTSATAWKSAWSSTLKKSGVEKCRFHDLRHSFVSRLLVDEGVDYATVMSLSGHKDIKMLLRYSHTSEAAKETAIRKLEKSLETPNYTPTSYSENLEPEKVVDISKGKG
jgi:integrase